MRHGGCGGRLTRETPPRGPELQKQAISRIGAGGDAESTPEELLIELAIETKGLTKRYSNGIVAIDNLDLHVRKGEVYGFLGPNGAGKTTTMRILVGLMRPSSGTATVVGTVPGHGLVQVGSLVEAPAFYPYLSARDNLKALTRYAGVPGSRIETVLAEVDLTDRAHDRYSSFSLGMKQRLGVAAALLKDPQLLILDEPSNGLDPQGIVEMRDLVRNLGKGERTVLLSSHQLAEVEQICDRVGVILRGKMVAEGTVAELRGQTGLALMAEPEQAAGEALVRLLGPEAVRLDAGAFRLDVPPGRAAEINRALVTSGIDVSELRPAARSLEDVFLQLTGDPVATAEVTSGPVHPATPAGGSPT